MTETRLCEAVWTLNEGPLDSERRVSELFIAVGKIVPMDPVRYDLNRRDEWRPYSGARLVVDVLTQRTQLVTIASSESIEDGGNLVMVSTGKQGKPPQAVARWWEQWPPDEKVIDDWRSAVIQAFEVLPLSVFVMRTEEVLRIEAAGQDQTEWNENWDDRE